MVPIDIADPCVVSVGLYQVCLFCFFTIMLIAYRRNLMDNNIEFIHDDSFQNILEIEALYVSLRLG